MLEDLNAEKPKDRGSIEDVDEMEDKQAKKKKTAQRFLRITIEIPEPGVGVGGQD